MNLLKFDSKLPSLADNTLPAIPSFGGNTLPENVEKAETALAELEPLGKIWNHSHSQWMWRHLNLSSFSPIKNLRQISAEISRKKSALIEVKFSYYRKQISLEKINQLLDESEEGLERTELQVDKAEIESGMAGTRLAIEGALKDVLTLHDLYLQIKEQTGEITEADAEAVESLTHLQRSIQQCLRDIRQFGSITKGEQEYLEQIGVNPSKMQHTLQAYLEEEERSDWSTAGLAKFVQELSDELINVYKVDITRMKVQGFDSNPKLEHLTNGSG